MYFYWTSQDQVLLLDLSIIHTLTRFLHIMYFWTYSYQLLLLLHSMYFYWNYPYQVLFLDFSVIELLLDLFILGSFVGLFNIMYFYWTYPHQIEEISHSSTWHNNQHSTSWKHTLHKDSKKKLMTNQIQLNCYSLNSFGIFRPSVFSAYWMLNVDDYAMLMNVKSPILCLDRSILCTLLNFSTPSTFTGTIHTRYFYCTFTYQLL